MASNQQSTSSHFEDFEQLTWDDRLQADCRAIVELAWKEDLADVGDWTTNALVPKESRGAAVLVARENGIVAGLPAVVNAIETLAVDLQLSTNLQDGDSCQSGAEIAELSGSVRDLLSCERIVLNLISRLTGIATLTGKYVAEIAGTTASVYDTRKTTPGWRRLEKYATRCGGARNHRTGLFDAVMIKDNHLAHYRAGSKTTESLPLTAEAVEAVRKYLRRHAEHVDLPIEIEVDTLEQLVAVLPANPNIVLLDNMSVEKLRNAVALRDEHAPRVQLEASGGVTLGTLRKIAETGVERISVGALTHSARSLDIGLDWRTT